MLGVAAIVVALAWGTLAATRLEGSRPLVERLGLGLALGLALELWLPFLLAIPFGLRGGAIGSLWVSSALLGLEARRNRSGCRALASQVLEAFGRGRRSSSLAVAGASVLAVGFLAYLSWTHSLCDRGPDGLWTAGYGFGDQAMHTTFASSFLYGPGFLPPQYPIYAGWSMSYPFVPDFAIASLVSLSPESPLSLGAAFSITLAVALAALFLLLVSLARRWTGRGAMVGFVAAALFFASGGLEAWEVVAKLLTQTPFDTALMAGDLTQNAELGFVLNNVTNGILLPARNAAFGMALGAAALVLLTRLVDEGRAARRDAVVGGTLIGLLPMVHTHSFLALSLVAAAWATASIVRGRSELASTLRDWAWALVPLGVVALPQVLWVMHGLGSAESFSSVQVGWESETSSLLLWLWFWLKNAGLFGALSVLAFALASGRERILVAPFAALFFLCNLGHIQPWSHDNVKLFAWVWLAFAPLVAGLLARTWRRNVAGKVLAVQGLVLAVATGTLVLAREARLEVRLVDSGAVSFAAEVRERTPRDAVILTASSHNHPVPMLAGRTIALGYKGWLWPHGVNYHAREAQVQRIYAGKPDARALLEAMGVSWVVVGPDERQEFPNLDERALGRLFGVPTYVGFYRLYKVR